jgi:hypothetical protein
MANQKLFYEMGLNYSSGATMALIVPIGAAGAPGTPTLYAGFKTPLSATIPLNRTGAGLYTLSLNEPWALLIWYSILTIQATVAAGDGLTGIVTSTANLASAGTLTFTMLNNASAAADPRNGAILQVLLGLKNNANLP